MFEHWDVLEKTKILVVGDVMLDQYWRGEVSRISPEAPVPVVSVTESSMHLGGAGNVCANLSGLCVRSTLHASVGDDSTASDIRNMLCQHDIADALQVFSGYTTIKKLRSLSRAHHLLRMDFEELSSSAHDLDCHAIDLAPFQMVIISDYCKGAVNNPQTLIRRAKTLGLRVCVDTKKTDLSVYKGIDLLKPNRAEFEALGGCCDSFESIEETARLLMVQYDIAAILVTLGKDGMMLIERNASAIHFPSEVKEVFDVTGAGDTVIATLAALWGAGADLSVAVSYANKAAAAVVERLGTSTVSLSELQDVPVHVSDDCSNAQLIAHIQSQTRGKRLVMTNGCFDVLHAGHVQYLEQARALGDCLLVAVNTDDSVRRLKGASRPINTVADRQMVLRALKSVDWVLPFSSDTPADLIRMMNPAVLVKGGDYTVDQIAGADFVLANGGDVRILPLRAGCSSTRIIEAMAQ